MDYRISQSGCIYRQYISPYGVAQNQMLTPFGWTLAVSLLGVSGWNLILCMTQPVAINPTWPA